MRFLARISAGLCGLALVTSAMVKADDPAPPPSDATVPQAAQVTGHHHKGLFGWRHCVECQRAYAKKHYGVDVPPRPRPPQRQPLPVLSFMITIMEFPVPLARGPLS